MKKYILYLYLAICLSVISTILWVNYGNLLGEFVDYINMLSLNSLWMYIYKLIFYVVLVRVLNLLSNICISKFTNEYILEIKNRYINHIYKLKWVKNEGKILNRLNTELTQIKRDYLINIVTILSAVISFVLSSIYLFKIHIIITLLLYLLVLIIFIIPYISKGLIERKQKLVIELEREQISEIQDGLNGFEIIRNFEISNFFISKILKQTKKHAKENMNFEILTYSIGEISHCLISLVGGLGFILGGYYVFLGKITYGSMIAIVQLTNTMISPINIIINYIPKMIAGRRLLEDLKKDINDINSEVDLTTQFPLSEVKSIIFDDVSYAVNGKQILSHFTYKFYSKKRYLIIGESGSGKSTLLNILCKRIEDYEGTILINGINLKDISHKDLSLLISYQKQMPYIFNSSIKDNILFDQDFNIEDLLTKVKINKDKLELATNLSGGEKERIALCRILKEPHSICIFDEITSHLDIEISKLIEEIVFSLDNDITFYVAHHMTSEILERFDEVLDFNQLIN